MPQSACAGTNAIRVLEGCPAVLKLRVLQLVGWAADLELPMSVWISGLFNPQAFLTAISQTTARAGGLPLDQMTNVTDVTTIMDPKSIDKRPERGVYVHGFCLEGARWDVEEGQLADSFLKDLHPAMPVVNVISVTGEEGRTDGTGGSGATSGYYEAPVYITNFRGPDYVFPATLKTDKPESKWVLAAVAVLMSDD